MRSLACLLLLLLTSSAYADESTRCQQSQTPKFHTVRQDGRLIHVLETPIIICHHVPRPNVAYVSASNPINYVYPSLKQDFLPQILASVTKAPF